MYAHHGQVMLVITVLQIPKRTRAINKMSPKKFTPRYDGLQNAHKDAVATLLIASSSVCLLTVSFSHSAEPVIGQEGSTVPSCGQNTMKFGRALRYQSAEIILKDITQQETSRDS